MFINKVVLTEIRRIFCDAFDDIKVYVKKWLQQHVVCQMVMLNIL